jgi:TonB-dependent starch-binding outer membrane protein SusC
MLLIFKVSMMKKLLLYCLCFLGFWIETNAQTRQITGQIIDANTSEALPGVNIAVKGTNMGITTNADGKYTLKVSNDATLLLSFVGYTSQSVKVGVRSVVNIGLLPTVTMLDEVVYIGYAPVNKRDVTGSVSSVGAKQLRDIPLTNAAEALTGKLAGVRVTTSEGAPGAEVQIRVRGGGSITQDNSPIYVVDGIQVENALNFISPQDIESIDVLKDASSTAIYGARGANGVVIITTKSGKTGRTTVSYNGSTGYRQIFKKLDVMSPYEKQLLLLNMELGTERANTKRLMRLIGKTKCLVVKQSIKTITLMSMGGMPTPVII